MQPNNSECLYNGHWKLTPNEVAFIKERRAPLLSQLKAQFNAKFIEGGLNFSEITEMQQKQLMAAFTSDALQIRGLDVQKVTFQSYFDERLLYRFGANEKTILETYCLKHDVIFYESQLIGPPAGVQACLQDLAAYFEQVKKTGQFKSFAELHACPLLAEVY